MDARTFNAGIMSKLNEAYSSRVLHIPLSESGGPDLYDGNKFIEVKFTLINPKPINGEKLKNYPISWTVLENQMKYGDFFSGIGFWGLGMYELDWAVQSINTYSHEELEKMVLRRDLYIVPWNWMYRYPANATRTYRYPKFKDLPVTHKKKRIKKGYVYFTKGVDSDLFTR